MQALGCEQALNLDGGASMAMYYRGRTVLSPGRKLTNVLLVYE
jgi:exopolysaccharide biosynthesis protein